MTEDEMESYLILNNYFMEKEKTNDNNEKRANMGSYKNI